MPYSLYARLQEKSHATKKMLYMAFVRLEKGIQSGGV